MDKGGKMKIFLRISVLVIIALLVFGLTKGMAQFGGFFGNPLTGKPAPDFTLDTTQNKSVNMTSFRDGKPAILFFWATWCLHCRDALQDLKSEYQAIDQKGIKLILVDVGESEKQVLSYLKSAGVNLEVFLDERNSAADDYAVIGVPTFYFVDRGGTVVDVKHSFPRNYQEILN